MLSKLSRCAAAAACLSLLAVTAASAAIADPIGGIITAAATAPGPTEINVGGIWDAVAPMIVTALGAVATVIIGFLAKKANDVFHVTLEQKYRDSLHSAAVTGINLAVSKFGDMVRSIHPDTKNVVTASAVNWVISSVPDALRYLGVSQSAIEQLVQSKAEQMLGLSTLEPVDPGFVVPKADDPAPSATGTA